MPSRKVSDEQILAALNACPSANHAAKSLGIAWAVLRRRCTVYGTVAMAVAFDNARHAGRQNRGYRADKQPFRSPNGAAGQILEDFNG